ncbi:LysR substrate-binding domain-containing protein [Roseobacter fucihabitans]|uniref:LysR substrate-binding domain-containing protein n=1 Tax=Roseobacter fucihabitans TaxID=1537242 RepID=UPI0021CCBA8A|nr:LysR substrate-binding domain-containing protein [Roseobacter litoralis]
MRDRNATATRPNSGAFLVEAAKAGLGVSLEPTFICGEALKSGALIEALTDYDTYDRVARIVRPENRPLSFRVREFSKLLMAEWSKQELWNIG